MEAALILEVCGADGRLRERHRLRSFPISVGRGYQNDIIIDDPFVCADHLLIENGNGDMLLLRDRSSVNGLYMLPEETRVEHIEVAPGLSARIGHTVLRFVSANETVAPTRRDQRLSAKTLRQLGQGRFAFLLFSLLVLLQWVMLYELSYREERERDLPEFLATVIAADLLLLLAWSGAWSLVSRITVHQTHFLRHLSATVLAGLAVWASGMLFELLGFAFNAGAAALFLSVAAMLTVSTAQLAIHLCLASRWSLRRGATVGALVVGTVAAIVGVVAHAGNNKFSDEVPLAETLKPPSFKVAAGISVGEFIAETAPLEESVTALARRQANR